VEGASILYCRRNNLRRKPASSSWPPKSAASGRNKA
jgi:hypothetical protein